MVLPPLLPPALMGLECDIYMGAVDIERQKLNVFRMELLGARVVSVEDGLKTLNEAVDAAIQAWIKEIENVFYVLGSAVGLILILNGKRFSICYWN